MAESIGGAGVLLNAVDTATNPAATAHKPWAHGVWKAALFPHKRRNFIGSIAEHVSVQARREASPVIADLGEKPTVYR